VKIPVKSLRGKDCKLSVSAVDHSGALGTHYVFVTAAE
jgi:hypothetical protein